MTKRGVDHGIGGRDNVKSRQRRAKNAEKTKKLALAALQNGRKREVIFSETARVEWLTGFSKRKLEKRKFGLTMQIEKDKKKHKDEVKSNRQVARETHEKDGEILDVIVEEMKQQELLHNANVAKEMMYQDEQTKLMFGDSVTVVVDRGGLADQLEAHLFPADKFEQEQKTITKGFNKVSGGGKGRQNQMPSTKGKGSVVKKISSGRPAKKPRT
jgi:hypothetical protein